MFFGKRFFDQHDELKVAQYDAVWRNAWEAVRASVEAAPPFDPQCKCIKCGGDALPKYFGAETRFGVKIPERLMMTCACGFKWPMRPRAGHGLS